MKYFLYCLLIFSSPVFASDTENVLPPSLLSKAFCCVQGSARCALFCVGNCARSTFVCCFLACLLGKEGCDRARGKQKPPETFP